MGLLFTSSNGRIRPDSRQRPLSHLKRNPSIILTKNRALGRAGVGEPLSGEKQGSPNR